MSTTSDIAKLKAVLEQLPIVLQQKVVTRASRASAKVIADDAKRRVARRTGLLKSSIGVAKAKPNDTPDNVVRYYILPKSRVSISRRVVINGRKGRLRAKTYAYYGHFVEFGTKNMKAQPFLLPAAKANERKVVEVFKDKVYDGVEKELKKMVR